MRAFPTLAFIGAALAATGCAFDASGGAAQDTPGDGPGDALGIDAAAPGPDGAPAPDAGPAPGTLESRRVATAPALDGEIDAAWATATALTYRLEDAGYTYGIHPSYGFDAAVTCRALHDDERIYFLIEVVDDVLVDDSTESYDDDAIELYLDGGGDRTGPYGDDDHWLVVQSSGLYQSYGPAAVGPDEGVIKETDDGYLVEIALARDDLGMPGDADALGFNLGLVDDDDLGSATADAGGIWYAPAVEPCPTCCADEPQSAAWCDTSLLGTLSLID